MGDRHAHHLHNVPKECNDVTENWKGDMYTGINLIWDYGKGTCRLIMESYISNLLIKLVHPDPKKPQHSLYKCTPIQYGAKIQYNDETPDINHLDDSVILCVKSIVGALL